MAQDFDLEYLREVFKDRRTWMVYATVKSVKISSDKSTVFCQLDVLGRDDPKTGTPWTITARLGRSFVGPAAGDWDLPSRGDLALVALPDGEPALSMILCYASSTEDTVPTELDAATTLWKAKTGQKMLIKSQGGDIIEQPTDGGKIRHGSPASDEPHVLGNVNKDYMTELHRILDQAPQIGFDAIALPVFLDPQVRLELQMAKLQYLDTPATNILSQKAFTERGDA